MDELTNIFWNEGLMYAKYNPQNLSVTGHRKFRSFFGISPNVCALIWKLVDIPPGAEPKHLLWCMLFMKRYNTEHVNAAIVEADEKTFRFWSWRFIYLISKLDVIKWEKRHKNSNYSNMFVTLDGTDFKIREPTIFSAKWFSHKFNAPGVRYEVGISIGNGDIVWASGGFPCGEWSDLKIAKDLYLRYANNEITLADKGYRFQNYFQQPTNKKEHDLLSRHETLNGRLKHFEILNSRFRNNLKKHPTVFHACINILQLSIENGEKLFDV